MHCLDMVPRAIWYQHDDGCVFIWPAGLLSLREIDSLLVLKEGELEDSYSDETFVKLINYYIAETGSATFLPLEKLNLNKGRVEQVSRFWRRNNLGEFDKLEFARLSSKRLQSEDVPREFTRIIGSIKEAAHGKEALRFS